MSMQRSIRTSLAGAVAVALCGIASIATAQAMPQQPTTQQVPPPPPPPPPMQQTPPVPPSAPMPPPPPPATTPMPPPAAPMTMQPQSQPQTMAPNQPQGSSVQFYQGTQSTATYPIQNGTLTVNAGMPQNVKDYGPPPTFQTLDTNQDGRISQAEAKAYPPLDSDFLFASRQAKTISQSQYQRWVQDQH